MAVTFVGTGGTYFGIWITNLLLMIVTLGLYYPWARVRKLQFFASNTVIGDYPMHFHGVPRRMFGGFLLAVLAFLIYTVADNLHPLLGLAAMLVFGLLWPLLLRAALRFRLGNSSWRGLRLAFTGTTSGAYRAVGLPLAALALMATLVTASLAVVYALGSGTEIDGASALAPWVSIVPAFTLLVLMALIPNIHYRVTRYRQENLRYASERARFEAGPAGFYMIYGLTIGSALLVLALIAWVMYLVSAGREIGQIFEAESGIGAAVLMLIIVIGIVAWHLARSTFEALIFNLVWNNTRSEHLVCEARLSLLGLWFVRLTNSILIALTLGLYTPFAQVRLARLQRRALSIETRIAIDGLIADAKRDQLSAASDAAADLFDLDLGL
ncbi:MAG: YjgN family protein [Burkholderiaceae bacterium]